MQTDHTMGEIQKALAKIGQAENTLMIFTSDNGCSKAAGIPALAKQGHKVSADLRGSKADLWDGGHRIPFIVKWPGKVKPGSTSNQLICLTDLFATLSDMLKKDLPVNAAEDSVSFLPAFFGKKIVSTRAGVIHHSISGHFAYRRGPWKLLLAKASGGWTSPTERQAPASSPDGQLYNMSADLGEKKNLYEAKPHIVAFLLAQLNKDINQGRSTKGPKSKNDFKSIRLWKSRKSR
jgi:arylsulfatase A-like enzyme